MENNHHELDEELIDQERAAELQRMADVEIARLDAERQEQDRQMDLNLDRALADIERDMMKGE